MAGPGVDVGQGDLACCSSCGHKESDTTEQLNNNNFIGTHSKSLKAKCKETISLQPVDPIGVLQACSKHAHNGEL